MPVGDPTRTVRLPVRFLDRLQAEADRMSAAGRKVTVSDLIVHRMSPRPPAGLPPVARCGCASPKLSKIVSSLCTECGLLR